MLPTIEEVTQKDHYFFLHKSNDFVSKREKRRLSSVKKWAIAKKMARILSLIPTIQLIGVTGGLAVNSADESDDIDFLIVASPGFLWITRFLSSLLLDVLRARRKPYQKNVKDFICLNMFLDKDYMGIFPAARNIYSAHEVLQMRPLLNRKGTYERFLVQNRWVEEFLPNLWNIRKVEFSLSTLIVTGSASWSQKIVYPLEWFFYVVQKGYMKKRITTERITLHQIKFHPSNLNEKIPAQYEKTLDRIRFLP